MDNYQELNEDNRAPKVKVRLCLFRSFKKEHEKI